MLFNLMLSARLRAIHDVSFSYIYSSNYQRSLTDHVLSDFPIFPLHLPLPFVLDKHQSTVKPLHQKLLNLISYVLLFFPCIVIHVIALWFLFRKIRPDVVHINNAGYPAALSARAAAIAARLAGVRVVVMVVNNIAVNYNHPSRWVDYIIDLAVRRCVLRFVTGSKNATSVLTEVLNLPRTKCTSIQNGVVSMLSPEFCLATRERYGLLDFQGIVFGVAAHLVPRKGHIFLLNAARILASNSLFRGRFVILIEGKGSCETELLDFVRINNLAGCVKFIGTESRIRDFFNILDIFVLPSIQDEDFPNVILEAMSCGLPVISTRLAGIPEQIDDNVTGILVATGNSEELAHAMADLIQSDDRRVQMGISGMRRYHQHFSCDISVDKYLRLYGNLLFQ